MPEIIVKLGDNVVQKYFFFQEPLSIGRSPENEIVIENLTISRQHATIHFENGRYCVADLGSSNGTYVNGVKVTRADLCDKDVVTVGKHKLHFYDQRTSEVVHQPSMADSDSTMLVDMNEQPVLEAVLVINKGRQKDQIFKLSDGQTSLGRGADNDIHLTDWFVSKQHAQIERRDQKLMIRDLGSWRHTFVNGEQIEEAPLYHGDAIQLGPTVELILELRSSNADATVEPRRLPRELSPDPDVEHAFDATGLALSGSSAAPVDDEQVRAEQDELMRMADDIEQAAEADVPAADQPGSPLVQPAAQPADSPEAVYEDLADAWLMAAAGAATGENAVDRAAAASDDAQTNASSTNQPAGLDGEIQLWQRALSNKSQVIRKQAARRLKQLTGKDYDY